MRKTVRFTFALGLVLPAMATLAQGPTGSGTGAPDSGGVLEPSADASTEAPAPETPASVDEATTETPSSDTTAATEKQPAARSSSRLVEEVIVTAQKREEKLMSVPLSVQAFSPEALDARGVKNTEDLMKITPSLDYGTQAGSFTSVYMRGVGSEAWLTSDPSVATYVDGVYYPFSPSVAQDLGGVERVEILKGPQGTLFGRNANGGAINVIIKEPKFDDRSITASQYYGSFNTYRSQIFANVPVTETFAANVSAYFQQDATTFDSESTIAGSNVPKNKNAAARLKLRWLPTETLDLRATVQGTKGDGTHTLASNIAPTLLGQAAFATIPGATRDVAADARNRKVNTDLPIYGHTQSLTTSVEGIYNYEYFDTKLLGSYQSQSNPYNYDYDGTEFPGASFIVHRHFAKISEGEIQFLSNEGTPGADWLTLTGGAFYFRNVQGFDPVEVTVGGANPANLGAVSPALGAFLEPITTEVPDGNGGFVTLPGLLQTLSSSQFPSYALSNIGIVLTESWSTYIQATAKLTDALSLTLGGRYQNERRGVLESNTSIRFANVAEPVVFDWRAARLPGGAAFPLHDVTKGFKPKIALDYLFDDGTLLYASYQEAVKAHSYNAFAFYLRPAYVPEEELEAYEIGLKTSLFDNTTRVTVAAWNYDITNLQTQAISLLNGGALSISTAGNARSRGLEFDIFAELFPSVLSGTVVTLNGAYTDAIYTDYTNAQGHQEGTGIFLPSGQDYTGNQITRAAKYTGSLALSQTLQIPGGPLEGTVSAYYNSGFFYEASENPLFEQPKYTTIGAHISYLYEAQNLRVTLSGQNLTDKFYTAGELLLDFGALATIAPPRTIGLRLDWSF